MREDFKCKFAFDVGVFCAVMVPAESDIMLVLLEVVDSGLDIGSVLCKRRCFAQIAKRQCKQMFADQRFIAFVESLVVLPHDPASRPESLLIEIQKQRIHVGFRIPHQLVGDVITATVQSPVVAAFTVEACGAKLSVTGDSLPDVFQARAISTGWHVEIPQPDREVLIEACVSTKSGPQFHQFVEGVPAANESGC